MSALLACPPDCPCSYDALGMPKEAAWARVTGPRRVPNRQYCFSLRAVPWWGARLFPRIPSRPPRIAFRRWGPTTSARPIPCHTCCEGTPHSPPTTSTLLHDIRHVVGAGPAPGSRRQHLHPDDEYVALLVEALPVALCLMDARSTSRTILCPRPRILPAHDNGLVTSAIWNVIVLRSPASILMAIFFSPWLAKALMLANLDLARALDAAEGLMGYVRMRLGGAGSLH